MEPPSAVPDVAFTVAVTLWRRSPRDALQRRVAGVFASIEHLIAWNGGDASGECQ
jgi:hypothetical protein